MADRKDPAIQELQSTLDYHKAEYKKATGKDFGVSSTPAAPAPKAAPAAQGASIPVQSDGKNVTVNGKSYPLGADGTVMIDGKKYTYTAKGR